jgi:hypothetical protein
MFDVHGRELGALPMGAGVSDPTVDVSSQDWIGGLPHRLVSVPTAPLHHPQQDFAPLSSHWKTHNYSNDPSF